MFVKPFELSWASVYKHLLATMNDVDTMYALLPTTACSSPLAATSLFSLFDFAYVGKDDLAGLYKEWL